MKKQQQQSEKISELRPVSMSAANQEDCRYAKLQWKMVLFLTEPERQV